MIDINKPFGISSVVEFKKGDLLYWCEWMIDSGKLEKKINFGVYLGGCSEFYGLREVFFGNVLCSETGDKIKVLAVRLKKAETN
jgi:hypothetical protein